MTQWAKKLTTQNEDPSLAKQAISVLKKKIEVESNHEKHPIHVPTYEYTYEHTYKHAQSHTPHT